MVWVLALIGFMPFVAFTIMLVLVGKHSAIAVSLIDASKTYSAVVLSFLSGIRWGEALTAVREPVEKRIFAVTILAPLFAWIAIFLPEPMCFAMLIVIFAALGAWDNYSAHWGSLPDWYATMRMTLTILVIALLAVEMFVTG